MSTLKPLYKTSERSSFQFLIVLESHVDAILELKNLSVEGHHIHLVTILKINNTALTHLWKLTIIFMS